MPSAYTETTHAVDDLSGTKLDGIEDGATQNTGDLADLDTVDTDQIDDDAITVAKLDTSLESTNYQAGVSGWKLTKAGVFEAGSGTFRGDVTATSITLESGASLGSLDLDQTTQDSLALADSALQDEDTSVNLGLTDGSVGGITINSTSVESTNFASGSAGFKLESDGTFEVGDGTFRGGITATSITLEGTTIAGSQLDQTTQDSLGLADSAIQDEDTGLDLGITAGTIAGVTINSTTLYQGTGTFNNDNTGFYLDNQGQFSLKDKLSFDGSDLTVDGDITARDLNITNATVTGTLSADNLAIDGVTLDTNADGEIIIKDNGVGNDQMGADSVAASTIIEGSVSKVNPVTQSQNVYRWGGFDDAGNGVNAVPSGITLEYDATEQALELRNDGNVGMRSDTFVIDQNSIYKVSMKIKKTGGAWYVGLFQNTAFLQGEVADGDNVQTQVNFTRYAGADRAVTTDTNAYFAAGSGSSVTSYTNFVFYILGANVDIDEVPQASITNSHPYLKVAGDAYKHVGLRILNWSNGGTTNSLFVKDLSVVEMTATTIIAENISTTNLAAINSDLGDITAGSLNINSGAFSVTSDGVMSATGHNKWRHNSNIFNS